MRRLHEIWYDKYTTPNGVFCTNFYIVGEIYNVCKGAYVLEGIERIADTVILSFEKGVVYEIPVTDDMSFVYKEEDNENT